jgi:hypothetical protein
MTEEFTQNITADASSLPYYKYYLQDMAKVDPTAQKVMAQFPINPLDATPVQDRNDLLKPGYLKTEIGYCQMPDGTAFLANYMKMPNVTAEMFHWWFAWHGLEPMRYIIWNKDDHYDVVVKNGAEEQLKDNSLSMAERIYGVTHTVTEDTGFGPEKIDINFENPVDLGYDPQLLTKSDTEIVAAANGETALMLHSVRPIEGGVELRSRFWLGWNVDLKSHEPVRLIPENAKIDAEIAKRLGLHSIKEMTNLAKILPSVYRENKNRF